MLEALFRGCKMPKTKIILVAIVALIFAVDCAVKMKRQTELE
jgi:hypothetical protein